MRLLQISLLLVGLVLTSCSNEKKDIKNADQKVAYNNDVEEGLKLIQKNCYACHSVASKSHDEIIAPPLVAVKRRYLMSFPNKEEFMEAFTSWVLNPNEENALMRGAVTNFKVMPKQNFKKEDIEKISEYIFDNEIEKPIWFESHFNTEHPNGAMRNGQGKGRSRGMNSN